MHFVKSLSPNSIKKLPLKKLDKGETILFNLSITESAKKKAPLSQGLSGLKIIKYKAYKADVQSNLIATILIWRFVSSGSSFLINNLYFSDRSLKLSIFLFNATGYLFMESILNQVSFFNYIKLTCFV